MSQKSERGISALIHIVVGCGTILLLVAGLGYWATMATITGAVISGGTVEVESNRQIIQHATGGVVSDVRARDGMFVSEGELLLRLDTAGQEVELRFAQAQLFELQARQNRLRAEQMQSAEVVFDAALLALSRDNPAYSALLDGQRQLFHATQRSMLSEERRLKNLKDQIVAQKRGFDAQEVALQRQLELIAKELATQRALLERKLTNAGSVHDLEREEAQLSGSLGELIANRASAAERLVEADLELMRLVTRRLEQGLTTSRDLDAPIRQYIRDVGALQDEISRAEVRAPVSGIVIGLTVHAGRAVVRPAEPLLYLIPQDRPLIVAMRVAPQHIDQVVLGQLVKLRLSAMDHRKTPEVWGRITQLSGDTLRDDVTGASFYRVEMVLPPNELAKLPEGAALLPGMPVEAFIRTGEHSPLAYLIKPVADYFARAFRES